MAEYKGIKGFKVQSLASDPSPAVEGQVWYNTTGNALKFSGLTAGTWASGGTLNNPRTNNAGAGRTQTAALALGGNSTSTPSPPYSTVLTESYDGSTWTETTDFTTARGYFHGCGPQTAALISTAETPGPYPTNTGDTEIWNGTAWTEVANVNNIRVTATMQGTVTATLMAGGANAVTPSPTVDGETEDYNGTAWTEVGDLNTARWKSGSMTGGTPSASLVFGGETSPAAPSLVGIAESWNGTSWTETADLGSARYGMGGAGTQDSGICFAGSPTAGGGTEGYTESWDGSSWTEVNDMVGAFSMGAYGGNTGASDAFAAGGGTSSNNSTEEWTKAVGTLTVTVT